MQWLRRVCCPSLRPIVPTCWSHTAALCWLVSIVPLPWPYLKAQPWDDPEVTGVSGSLAQHWKQAPNRPVVLPSDDWALCFLPQVYSLSFAWVFCLPWSLLTAPLSGRLWGYLTWNLNHVQTQSFSLTGQTQTHPPGAYEWRLWWPGHYSTLTTHYRLFKNKTKQNKTKHH